MRPFVEVGLATGTWACRILGCYTIWHPSDGRYGTSVAPGRPLFDGLMGDFGFFTTYRAVGYTISFTLENGYGPSVKTECVSRLGICFGGAFFQSS